MGIIVRLLSNDYFVWCAMAAIIFLITQIVKLPWKCLTKKLIKNERTRKIANAVILLIPFGLGVLGDFLYSTYYLHTAFTVITGLGYGTASISLYGIVERFFKVKIENPYETTEEGKAVTELVEKVQEDGKVDSTDLSAVDEFWEKINKNNK
ncbi:MAG: hypothetical protein NC131_01115 [Roseburia sp.]|nr:hypothetical protein [Roseburia sp.]